MKPRQESTATVVTSTQQRQLIAQLADKHLEEGGSILAQVFPDGLRVRVMTPAQTAELQQVLAAALGTTLRQGLVQSAFQVPQEGGAQ